VNRRHLVAGAALAALLLAACSSSSDEVDLTAPTQTRASADAPVTTLVGDGPLVVVLGDSNTYGTAPELEDALSEAGFTPDVRGISGSGLFNNGFDWLPAAAAVAPARPALVVIALGTNDAVNDADVAAFPARADELLAALGELPVVWVTHTESGGAHSPADEKRINDAIRALPAAHPNVTVLDLAPFIAAQPDLLGDDRLHYAGEGREFFADQIAAAASARVTPPAP
jgi:lysophospholipase L1-like esterase